MKTKEDIQRTWELIYRYVRNQIIGTSWILKTHFRRIEIGFQFVKAIVQSSKCVDHLLIFKSNFHINLFFLGQLFQEFKKKKKTISSVYFHHSHLPWSSHICSSTNHNKHMIWNEMKWTDEMKEKMKKKKKKSKEERGRKEGRKIKYHFWYRNILQTTTTTTTKESINLIPQDMMIFAILDPVDIIWQMIRSFIWVLNKIDWLIDLG
jgi:hypothetical protein